MNYKYMRILGFFLYLAYSVLHADVHNNNNSMPSYSQNTSTNPFFDGNFDEIIRFDKLSFNQSSLDSNSKDKNYALFTLAL